MRRTDMSCQQMYIMFMAEDDDTRLRSLDMYGGQGLDSPVTIRSGVIHEMNFINGHNMVGHSQFRGVQE